MLGGAANANHDEGLKLAQSFVRMNPINQHIQEILSLVTSNRSVEIQIEAFRLIFSLLCSG